MALPVLDLRPQEPSDFPIDGALAGPVLADIGAAAVQLSGGALLEHQVRRVLRVMDLAEAEKWSVARDRLRPGSRFHWVGYDVHRTEDEILHETYDIGAHDARPVEAIRGGGAAFREITPLPEGLPEDWLVDVLEVRATLADVGRALIAAVARHLGRDAAAATAPFEDDNSTLRVLAYPAPASERADPIRGGAHEDSGAFTFIWEDQAGLEIQDRSGRWCRAAAPGWTVIAGESLSVMTQGALPATTHRVVTAGHPRRSLAFFFEPGLAAIMAPWPEPDAQATVGGDTYEQWLRARHHLDPRP